jgi:1,2-diacylglycerol 3-alpha-glucosyltransferase
MKSTKHVVIITPGFPKNESDDNCIPPLYDYVRHITTKENTRISVITLQYPANKSNYRWYNVNVYALGGDDVKFPGRFFIWKKAISIFQNINTNNSVDKIHSFWLSECALIGNYISSRYGIMHINTVMGKEANRSNRYLHFINFNKLKLIVLSKRQAGILKNATGRDADNIIPWGLNKNFLPAFENHERKIDVLGVGSLIALKNYSSFINIIHKLKEFKPEINCVILGGGSLKEKLNHQIKTLGLESNLTLAGNFQRHGVFDYMMRSKILLHTSSFESFGMVFIEALYYGLHIVSKPVGIARKSDKWSICNLDDEMSKEIVTLLSVKISHDSFLPYTMNETVKSYLNIFFPPD